MAFSRILNDQEIVFAANTNGSQSIRVEVIIEQQLSQPGDSYRVLYSNQANPKKPEPVIRHGAGTVRVAELDGSVGLGPVHTIPVALAPMEAQIIGK